LFSFGADKQTDTQTHGQTRSKPIRGMHSVTGAQVITGRRLYPASKT